MSASHSRIELQSFFENGKTLDVNFRLEQLRKLRRILLANEKRILRALSLDLKKSSFESYFSELGPCIREIDTALRNLRKWAEPKAVSLPLYFMPGAAKIYPQAYGKVLILAPWNYPFHLVLVPLIGAIAAGNVVLAKPSEHSPETSKLLREIFAENFDPGFIQILEGGVDISENLLELQWDYIFFTGSPRVGKIVLEKAAQHLTPVTLELGGKSPAWIDASIKTESAKFETALKRVLWAKFVNVGQTCIAPDYLILHRSHMPKLKETAERILIEFFGSDPQHSPDFGRIINEHHTQRLINYLQFGKALVGGKFSAAQKYISPTLLVDVPLGSAVMKEEIFGPILPVIEYTKESEVYEILNLSPNPLAFYLFSDDKRLRQKVLEQIPFGGGCFNDCLLHWGVEGLPAGGVGTSGMGSYHGQKSFETFSRQKSVLSRWSWPEPKFRYPPYLQKLSLLKRIFR